MLPFLLVGLGGFIGSIARFSISQIVPSNFSFGLPLPTLLVNLIGSFVIGFCLSLDKKNLNSQVTTFIIPGILGGFTTYSSFSADIFFLFKNDQNTLALVYIFVSTTFGLLLAFSGFYLGKTLLT